MYEFFKGGVAGIILGTFVPFHLKTSLIRDEKWKRTILEW
jgi:hypothetical protein